MKLIPLAMFTRAGATAQVFSIRGGRAKNLGPAWSGLVAPWTTLAVVPTTPIVLPFQVEARTKDAQPVTVTGSVTVTLNPEIARRTFDTAVDHATGAYRANWQRLLQDTVAERTLGPVRGAVKTLDVLAAIAAQPEIEAALRAALAADTSLAESGVKVASVAVVTVEAGEEVLEAAGAQQLQAMLAEADHATHERREKAAKNERAIKTYEVETAKELETKRGELIAEQGKNKLAEAEADAKATEARLKPFGDAKAENVLGAAILKMAERGVGNLTISPEILAVLRGGAAK